jgi:hypothetical protein
VTIYRVVSIEGTNLKEQLDTDRTCDEHHASIGRAKSEHITVLMDLDSKTLCTGPNFLFDL